VLGWFDENHRSDVLFALLQISNWQQIWEGVPYGTALASPVVHYWSLAIEEQAYLVLPLLIVLSGRARLLKIAVGLFALSALATFLADGSQSIIYFGTHTRAAEVLAGVIAAAFLHNTQWRPQRNISTALSLAGVGYLIWAGVFVHLKDSLVYSGGLLVTGLVSAIVIVTLPQSPLAKFFDLRPFVWLGTVSYGVYLLHWPILLTLKRTDLPHWSVPLITLVLTILGALLMHRRFELPMRFALTPRKVVAVLCTCVVLVSGGFVLAKTPPASFEDLQDGFDSSVADKKVRDGKIEIFFAGDSKLLTFTFGIAKGLTTKVNLLQNSLFTQADAFVNIACPLGRRGYFKNYDDEPILARDSCDWTSIKSPGESTPIAVIWFGTWDVTGRSLNEAGPDTWLYLDSPLYQKWLTNEYLGLVQHLKETQGVQQIFIIDYLGIKAISQQDAYNDFLKSLLTDATVNILNLSDYLQKLTVNNYFPDGIHLSTGSPMEYSPNDDNSAADLYEKWLEPALCAALLEKAPELLATNMCPEIDYSPRVKN
jgi:hypothetical protein